MPGKAHLVVSAARALDGHVEPVVDAQVLLLKKHLVEMSRDNDRNGDITTDKGQTKRTRMTCYRWQ